MLRSRRSWIERLAIRGRERVDVFLGFDPGLNQLLIAVGVMAGIAVTIALTYAFMQVTHALWTEAPAGVALTPTALARLSAQHHGETLLAMLLGGLIGMLSAFAVAETEPRQLTLTMAIAPVPMLATMALATLFTGHQAAGIAVMAIVMGIGVWMPKLGPRIGPRAFFIGQLLFVGYLFGFLSHGAVKADQLDWIAAILWFAALVNLLLKLLIFVPLSRGALRRTTRSFFARSRRVISSAAELFERGPGGGQERVRRRLRRRLVLLNEAALIVDGLLGDHAEIAHETHERMFEIELTVQNIGRLADALSAAELPPDLRRALGDCLTEIREDRHQLADDSLAKLARLGRELTGTIGQLEAGRVTRLADALVDWRLALARWREGLAAGGERAPEIPFESPVTLMFGNLPGSFLVSSSAAVPAGSIRARLGLDAPAQAGIRIAIAVCAAGAFGSMVSERRFYWAVIAVFIAFMGANTSGEQLAKAANRVLGTVIGILLGSLLAHAIGVSTWSAVVIVASIGLGVYLLRVSYAWMVIGVTVMVSQLYVQLGEYSNHLLVMRLEETAIGAGVATLAALLIFPVHTRHAARVATREYYARLGELLDSLTARLRNGLTEGTLTNAARGLDHASQQLVTTARPLSRGPFRRNEMADNLLLFGQASHHARNVAAAVHRRVALAPPVRVAAITALDTQRRLVSALEQRLDHLTNGTGGDAMSALTDGLRRIDDILPAAVGNAADNDQRLLLRHITRLDETLAELGDNLSRR